MTTRTRPWPGLLPAIFSQKTLLIALALFYAVAAGFCTWDVITRTTASTKAIEQILTTYDMKNEGSLAVDRYAHEHPILGSLFASPAKHELELPSSDESAHALGPELKEHLETVRLESSHAAWASWLLLNLSLAYVLTIVILLRSFTRRAVLFALTVVSVAFFLIGILAPAQVIWTAPSIGLASGQLNFVLQHQVRGIAAIIWELLTKGHWIVGGLLLLFSILTPLTKAGLTFFVTASRSTRVNFIVGEVLHAIGKWSMADVFVAGILLSLFALKAQDATKSIPCLGLYFFIGYCLLSMTTTELLTHSGAVRENGESPEKPLRPLRLKILIALAAIAFGFLILSTVYTYQQYTANLHEPIHLSSSPRQLNNADLVLPVHQK
jgi:hypothetical protein